MNYGKLSGAEPPERERQNRESRIRKEIIAMAEDIFPDDSGLEWIIHQFEHGGPFTITEAEPKPSTVGYPRFRFVIEFAHGEAMDCLGVYCFQNGAFFLLASNQGAGLPPKL